MIDALAHAIREAFGLVIASTLPLFAIAAAAALLIGLLGGSLSIRDAALGHIVRVLAVLLAIGLVIDMVAQGSVEFAKRSWAQLDGER
ncbi:MAG TPA: flagellar biosynthetic protein FliQ [Enhygromyxa sp.]|nr:flagellar biosynthetic protein FliQ [Enhygromyxa sp.]